jgi:hypothetical protein
MSAAETVVCGGIAEGGQPCTLPVGHNEGHPDLPENHLAAKKTRTVVKRIKSEAAEFGLKIEITVAREDDVWTTYSAKDRPRASDLPEDVREALQVWLNAAR